MQMKKNILLIFSILLIGSVNASVQRDTLWAKATFVVVDKKGSKLDDVSIVLTDTLNENHKYWAESGDTVKLPVGFPFSVSAVILSDAPVLSPNLIIHIKPHNQLATTIYRYTITINIVRFPDIHFTSGSAELTSIEKAKLDTLIRFYQSSLYPDYTYTIRGYTDNVGTRAANKSLSQRRAEVVWRYIESSTLNKYPNTPLPWHCMGYWGEDKEVDTNETEEGRANNRRVSIGFHPKFYVTAGDPCR
jgi:outer membrane protein OmpA-like peptidoglycan-associated protein